MTDKQVCLFGGEVYIVMKNGKIDEVFSDYKAAEHHRDMLLRKWNLTEIIIKDVNII
jgi:hypothetical protein